MATISHVTTIKDTSRHNCLSPQDKLRDTRDLYSQWNRMKNDATSIFYDKDMDRLKKEVVWNFAKEISSSSDDSSEFTDDDTALLTDTSYENDDFIIENAWETATTIGGINFDDDQLQHDIDWVANDQDELTFFYEKMAFPEEQSQDSTDSSYFEMSMDTTFTATTSRNQFELEVGNEHNDAFSDETLNIALPMTPSNDAEKLLMRFDTMPFTHPSPTNKKIRANGRANKRKNGEQWKGNSENANGSASQGAKRQKTLQHRNSDIISRPLLSDTGDKSNNSEESVSLSNNNENSTSLSMEGSIENRRKIGSYTPIARKLRIQKFHEKRKNRIWKKSIKYDCRKKLADDRPRHKGRFVRVMENDNEKATVKTESVASATTNVNLQSEMKVPPLPTTSISLVATSHSMQS